MPQRLTSLDWQTPAVELRGGTFTARWQKLIELLFGDVRAVAALPAVINRKTLTELNALGLGAGDAGYLAFETTLGHLLRWTGSVWEFAPGDVGNKFLRMFVGAPQEVGWQLCDGTVSSYLTVGGATLTTTAFTTPNVPAGTFLKALAVYTGAIDAAVAPGISGSVGSSGAHTHAVSGNTANESAHTHDGTTATGTTAILDYQTGGAGAASRTDHVHNFTTGAGTAHSHGAGSLGADSNGAHTHGAGTLAVDSAARPPSLGAVLYVRR